MGFRGIDNLQYGYEHLKTDSVNVTDKKMVDNNERKLAKPQDKSKDDNEQLMSEKEQQHRIERLQDTLKNHNIEISYNEEVNRYAIKVLDTETREVVKEIPSEKTLDMFAKMLEIEGLLVDEKR